MKFIFCLIALVPLHAEEGWVWKAPEIKAEMLSKGAPTIDGVLDDEAWKSAARSAEFHLTDGRAPKSSTHFLIMRDEHALYLAVECLEQPELLKTFSPAAEHDSQGVWGEDCVEIFIDPTDRRASYYQIAANAKGATWDAYFTSVEKFDLGWQPTYASAAKSGANSWILELALPLTSLDRGGFGGDTWAFNVSRLRKAAGELTYWSPVYNPSSHSPEAFGKLGGMPAK